MYLPPSQPRSSDVRYTIESALSCGVSTKTSSGKLKVPLRERVAYGTYCAYDPLDPEAFQDHP